MVMRNSLLFVGGVALGALAVEIAACGGGDCTEGRQTSCACADASVGVQVCTADGTYGACECGDGGGTTTTTTTTGGGGSTTTGSGGQGGAGGTPCDPPAKQCGAACVDVTGSDEHCGDCDQPCPATASCTAGVCVCPAEQKVCGTDCIDVSADDTNCGGCGHDCLGATCTAGLCDTETLAFGQSEPYALAVDATNVYFTSGNPTNKVLSVPLTGGQPVDLSGVQIFPRELALSGGVLYWSNYGTASNAAIMSYPLPNGPAAQVVGGLDTGVWGIAVAGDFVYWANQLAHTLTRESISSPTTPLELASAQAQPWDIAVAGTKLFWTNYASGDVRSMPIGGGQQQLVVSGQGGPLGIAVDSTYVYWSNNTANQIKRAPLAGGAAEVIASAQDDAASVASPAYLAVDGGSVYWANYGNGTVCKAPLGGGDVTVLAAGQSQPYYVAVDGTHAYWTTLSGGTVMRVPK